MKDKGPSPVSIKRCKGYEPDEVYRAVREALDPLGGMGRFVKRGERVLLKPNLLSAREPERAVTTHPSVVEAVIRLVMEEGAIPFIGDSPAVGRLEKVAEKAGILSLCRKYGVKLIDFRESVDVMNRKGLFKSIALSKEALSMDGIINLPKLKTHAQMFLTLSVKNMFGCVVGKRKVQWHLSAGRDPSTFAGLLLDIYLILRPRLNIVDGIVAMEGNGPGSGDPRRLRLILASPDGPALDGVITELLGARREDLPTTRVAMERGLLREARVIGDRVERQEGFRFPPRMMDVGWGLPGSLKRRLRNTLTPYPWIDHQICTLCRLCVETCPAKAMDVRGSKVVIDYDGCIRCFCCQEVCPEGAIESRRGLMARVLTRL